MSVMPKTGYQQGIHRHWKRRDKFDYYWTQFANIGEQEVINDELYHDFDVDTENATAFGYQQRYAEYKYASNSVHGDMRDELDYWHLSRKFANRPNLNAEFIESDPSTRIFAVDDGAGADPTDKLWIQLWYNVKAKRLMPYFADPRL